MSTSNFNSDLVRSLATLLDETNLTEIEYEYQGMRVRVARNIQVVTQAQVLPQAPLAAPVAAPAAPAAAAAAPAADDWASHPGAVKSPMVGVTYLAPEPGAARFVSVGDSVSEGQTLLLIEAMKTFNPIRAPRSGKVLQFLVEDGHPVEFGEPLVVIG